MTEPTIFLAALEIRDPAERRRYLETACAGDAALRSEVEALLAAHERDGEFLEVPALDQMVENLGVAAEELSFLAPSEKSGSLGRLNHYEVLEVIGRGGMGIVLRALDERLQRVVAIKVMAAQLATNAAARKRFTREAQAAAAVSHDHIVTIHAVEEIGGLPYLVMHCVAGLSLQQRLDRGGPLELHEVLRIGMQTAAGLAAAHAQGLIHRDVKPANILLENGVERVKITDFGLARAASDASLTQTGVVAGTPHYMSPEQALGEAVDQRSDLFSLGSVMYAMCTGRAPFRASGSLAVLKRVCEEAPTPIREANPDMPDWLVAIIDKLHAKDPEERFGSAAEVAMLLSRHLADVQHPSVAPLPARSSLGREAGDASRSAIRPEGSSVNGRRRWAVAAAIFVLILSGLAVTEAIGVTNLRATLIRLFTPDDTRVVEVDAPGQKPESPTTQASANAEKNFFVVLAAGKERKFETLAEAVLGASDGDTIEIRGNGPFVSGPIDLGKTRLTIRAGASFRPVIKLGQEWVDKNVQLFDTQAPLVLEGLELHRVRHSRDEKAWHFVVFSENAPLSTVNCRFVVTPAASAIYAIGSPAHGRAQLRIPAQQWRQRR